MCVPNITDVQTILKQLEIRSMNGMQNIYNINKEKLNKLLNSYILKNPLSMYEVKEQKFDGLYERIFNAYKNILNINKNKLEIIDNKVINSTNNLITKEKHRYVNLLSKLEVLNPLLTIKRGYTVTRKNDKVISSVKELSKDDIINLELSDGKKEAKVL